MSSNPKSKQLMISFLLRFQDPECYQDLQIPFARALIGLDKQPWRVLETWLGALNEGDDGDSKKKGVSFFKSLVNAYKSVAVHVLKKRHTTASARQGQHNAQLEVGEKK